MSRPAAKTWVDHVGDFVIHLGEEERSPHTISNYKTDVESFGRWYQARHGEPPELSSLSKGDLIGWKSHIELTGGRKGPAAPASINRRLSAMKKFITWAQAQNLAADFTAPKRVKVQAQSEPRSLKWEERAALLQAVADYGTPRDVLVIRLGIEAGLRVSEMASLLGTGVVISPRKAELIIKGKGHKFRVVPMTMALKNAFLAHDYQRYLGLPEPVLIGVRGALSIRGLQFLAEKYARLADLGGKKRGIDDFSIHCLRHTCCYWLLNHPKEKKRVTLEEAAYLMGHSDVNTTRLYATPHKEQLAARMMERDE
jgi:integrase/recombinase XerC